MIVASGGDLQSFGRQVPLHRVEQAAAQIVLLQQVAKAADRRLIGHRLTAKVDANKAPHRQRIVKRLQSVGSGG